MDSTCLISLIEILSGHCVFSPEQTDNANLDAKYNAGEQWICFESINTLFLIFFSFLLKFYLEMSICILYN